ncbi:MAG: hypothetical protein EA357_05450 [Micavibrio sp.]|nr:MAG: hypothetical protein EA357_05450 [Micavibrio sp.]
MALSREEASRVKDSIVAEFMSAARIFDEDGVNCVGITNSDVDWRNPAVDIGTKKPLTLQLKKEIEGCAEKTLGRKPVRGDLIFRTNGSINAL